MVAGVLLMTFGSAETADGVAGYLRSVRGGSEPSEEVVAEFVRRYSLIGRSPLRDITNAQVQGLQTLLDAENGVGKFAVAAGMLHSEPRISGAVAELAQTCDRVVGVIMSPQYSPQIMSGYGQVFAAALQDTGIDGEIAPAWYILESFPRAIAAQVHAALQQLPADVPVVFTAHSLPRRVVERDPDYIASLQETARSIAQHAGLTPERWQFAYQSAGHTPEEWLRPDFTELLPGLRDAGHTQVLVVPTQFVADHLEVLYDIDIAGGAEAKALGMEMHRTAMPNADPAFVRVLADVVRRHVVGATTAASV